MNRAYFFKRVRGGVFSGKLSQTQVDGMNRILDYRDAKAQGVDDDKLAYYFATTALETGYTMQPIKERGGNKYFHRMYDIGGARPEKARELGNIFPGDGAKYPGMGLVQSTGRGNARRARGIIKRMTGQDIDFEASPTLLMRWEYALPLMFEGFRTGIWTGHKISTYVNEGKRDYVGARRIINGTDKAKQIAQIAETFRDALEQAKENVADDPAAVPVPEDADQTTGKPMAQSTTVWAQIAQWASAGGAAALAAIGDIPWQTALVIGALGMVAAGAWIIHERYLKSKQEGV